ncbi:MAG: hypothetical protein ACFFFG_05025 [Candidatus Thorarchaeota archaeon]
MKRGSSLHKVLIPSILLVVSYLMLNGAIISAIPTRTLYTGNEVPIITEYNRYEPDGTSTILVALDINLLGEGKYFPDEGAVITQFEDWLKPFETKFGVSLQVKGITTYDPGENDSLDVSLEKVTSQISWQDSSGITDPRVNGNGYDWLIIYQEYYLGGHNRVNAVYGNALIIAHYQPLDWTSRQLILLHEVGHLFGAAHGPEGVVDDSWYGNQSLSFMNYSDLIKMHNNGWNKNNLPCDEVNFGRINATRYRFDLNDADGDNMPNYYEHRYELNPNENDSHEDKDDDGLRNFDEYIQGTDIISEDTDQDSFSDWAEVFLDTSPINDSEFPNVPIPVIVSDMRNTTVLVNTAVSLRWRAVSSNPMSYQIYQNGSNIAESPWEKELIQHQITLDTAGVYNFTAVVRDQDGDQSSSTIILHVGAARSTNLSWLAPLVGICFLVFAIRRKRRSIPSSEGI